MVVYGEYSILNRPALQPPRSLPTNGVACSTIEAWTHPEPNGHRPPGLAPRLIRYLQIAIDTKGRKNVDVRPRWFYLVRWEAYSLA